MPLSSSELLMKDVVDVINDKLVSWYKSAKEDYGVDGKGTATVLPIPKDEDNPLVTVVILFEENGKKYYWKYTEYVSVIAANEYDWIYNIWGESDSESWDEIKGES